MLLAAVVAAPAFAGQAHSHAPGDAGSQPVALNTHTLSYAIGYRIGSRFSGGHPDVDISRLIQGLRDAYANKSPSVSMDAMRDQLEALEQQMRGEARQAFLKQASTNAAKSQAFLKANAKRDGITTLPSGVQYKVLKKGSGAHPGVHSTVVVNYRGSLINGMEFDSSYAHGHSVSYPVDKMLPGWRDVLPRMRVGGKWKVFIPPAQAYGQHGELPRIGPNEVLIFEIELIGVK
ncbi:FKBP-type peptidyl-prolyl cis-trans isomerase [Oleiagrimonas sp. C23AA]|nr:FKBP-type peptidyl-prolyl cis-trans isomerase [Oleiagrimonas sp. C23AA]